MIFPHSLIQEIRKIMGIPVINQSQNSLPQFYHDELSENSLKNSGKVWR